jgi:hypothetical protein
MPRTGRPPVFDHVKQQTFLRLIAAGLSVRDAARQIGVSRSTIFHRKQENPAFAAACDQARFQTLPALLEHVQSEGARSWRASAWLLERLRPDLFGRRVALGFDPAVPKPPKPRPASVATEEMVVDFIDSLRLLPEAQAVAKAKLAELEDQQHAWHAARKAYAAEIDRRDRPHDFSPLDYIPLPGSLASNATPAQSPLLPETADVPDPTTDSKKSNNSTPPENAQLEPAQLQPTTSDAANIGLSAL